MFLVQVYRTTGDINNLASVEDSAAAAADTV